MYSTSASAHDATHEPAAWELAGLTLLTGGLLAWTAMCVQRTHRRRTESRPAALPERVQTWEGEGGRPEPEPGPEPDSDPGEGTPAATARGAARG